MAQMVYVYGTPPLFVYFEHQHKTPKIEVSQFQNLRKLKYQSQKWSNDRSIETYGVRIKGGFAKCVAIVKVYRFTLQQLIY